MLRPSKITLVTLGICTILWIGIWIAARPVVQDRQELPATPKVWSENSGNMEDFHSQLTALQNRLAQLEHERQHVVTLSNRLGRIEDAQHTLTQEFRVFMHQQTASPMPLRQQATSQKALETGRGEPPPAATLEERRQDSIEQFEATFWQEPEDSTWRADMETAVATALEDLEVPDTVLDWLQCQQSACRLEFVHPEGTGDATFVETVHTTEPFTHEFYAESTVDGDGQRRTLVYLARPGQPLFPGAHP